MSGELRYPLILCSFKLYEYCRDKYPKRKVMQDPHPERDEFYYWTRMGVLRLIRNKNEVWALGSEWPQIVRIR